jgi:DNA-binding LacI/PurR family transcriptional regulator
VTSVDVARHAGVSRATVSHILNDQIERFNEDTIERVRNAAVELGYVRSAAARALVMGRSDFIVVVVPYATFNRLQDVIDGLSADIESLGFTTVVHFSAARAKGETRNRLHHMIEALRPAGVFDLGGLSARDIAFIERVGCPIFPREMPIDFNSQIGLLQAEHLFSRGHTEIAYAFLSDARFDPYGRRRAAAVDEFCAAAGLAPPTQIHVPLEAEGARLALEGLLELRGQPVAIACSSDTVALALVFAAGRLGCAVPDDVAVVGAEGTEIGQMVTPRLTTIAGEVAGGVRYYRQALVQAYGPPTAMEQPAASDQVFRVVTGETT